MLDTLIGVILFLLGFFLGVFERKVDNTSIKLPIKTKNSELLITPEPKELERQGNIDFYDSVM